jgi:signal transduction histidine kinase
LDIKDSCVKLIVEDDGVGFEADKVEYSEDRHLGIAGMKERTLLLNGRFTIESSQGQGTTIYACIPLQRRDINEITNQTSPCG